MISEGVAKVKARIQTCGDKSSAKGTVNVSVKVSAAGGVTSVTVNSSPDAGLGSCVAERDAEGDVQEDAERRLVPLSRGFLKRARARALARACRRARVPED